MNEKIGVIIDFLTPAYEKTLRDTAARCGYDIVFFPSSKAAAGNGQADRQRLAGQRHPVQPDALGKGAHALGRIVGHDGQAYAGCAHLVQPRLHGVLQHLTVVSSQGVIHVEHEGFDAVCREKIRADALDGFEDVFRG